MRDIFYLFDINFFVYHVTPKFWSNSSHTVSWICIFVSLASFITNTRDFDFSVKIYIVQDICATSYMNEAM